MTVKRIVANVAVDSTDKAAEFYRDLLQLEILMDQGWITTFGNRQQTSPQISFATQGGSGTPVPDLSIEVDNLEEVYEKAKAAGYTICHELTEEPWGVKRFYVEDPFGRVINILSHLEN